MKYIIIEQNHVWLDRVERTHEKRIPKRIRHAGSEGIRGQDCSRSRCVNEVKKDLQQMSLQSWINATKDRRDKWKNCFGSQE